MSEYEILRSKFINVYMNETKISTNDKPIIGTGGLQTCIGFILYNKDIKKAIVGHVSTSKLINDDGLEEIRKQIKTIVDENKLNGLTFDLMLVEGGEKYKRPVYNWDLKTLNLEKTRYSVFEILEETLKNLGVINIGTINKNFSLYDVEIVGINTNEPSKRFAFNANTGKFLTSYIFSGDENSNIKEESYHI